MHYTKSTRLLSMLLAIVMIMGALPMSTFATEGNSAAVAADAGNLSSPEIVYTPHDDYYKVISKTDYVLAPGITESEIVLNSAAGSHRQVAHVVEVDVTNPYAKVIPSTYKMAEGLENKDYKVQIMSQQAAYAEANGYGNVVAAMNLSLSWYDSNYYIEHPELVGEPLGYLVLDGEVYKNSQGQTSGAQTVLVINFDEKDGVARPDSIPKTEIRSTSTAITGWEEQVIPANFGFLVKDGKNQYAENHTSDPASRSFVGIKADGTIVMVMNDGRQAPFSTGFNNYEMAEFMLSLGCVQAVNGDGGGSSAFLSQRPGEDLKVNCSPSDGAERPTTHGILVISSAPADGQFARANITAEHDFYTPGSTVTFTALGTDLVGTEAEIPADATWQLADSSMGTIENGVFVSSGKVGTATAQLVWNDVVVGEASVEIVIPTEFSFTQAVMTVPFDKEVNVGLLATINGGLNEVVLKPEDVILSTTNEALGTFNGLMFTSVSQENAPTNLSSTLTATLVHNKELVATTSLSLGKGSEVLFDFESAEDVSKWSYYDVNGNDAGFVHELSFATAEDGQVHNGNGSMRLYSNAIAAPGVGAGGYAQLDLYLDEPVIVENAKSIGFWAYIPDEYEHCWIRVLYWYDSNNDGIFDKKNTVTVINQPEVYNTVDENGWRYFSVDVSAYAKVLIPGTSNKSNFGYTSGKNDANNFRFIEFMFPHTNTNDLWKTHGTLNGPYTIYVDNITADFSDAVDDREAPIFGTVSLMSNDSAINLEKYKTVTTTSNLLSVSATVAENTTKTNATGLNASSARAYVDGIPVGVSYANGRIAINDIAVADGIHRVKFEIADNMGNKAVVIRLINVQAGQDAPTVQLVPKDATLDRLYGGSVYWMDLKATDIETIQSVSAEIDLNSVNHWELDHMELAAGFTGTYTIDSENNTAAITITRTGVNEQTGEAVLASLPIRILSFDTDIRMEGYTAETYWNTFDFWPQDLKVDVDMGEITFVEDYRSEVLGAFSNEEFSVDHEMYAPSSYMDPAFKAERGTCHVHTPEAMEDKPVNCVESGYTGRTYCAVCNSVVDWGTTVPAAGHTYEAVDGKLVCQCGAESDATGLVMAGEKAYYAVSGKLMGGWIQIEDGWYYFDNTTFEGLNGEQTADSDVKFVFENGRLTAGKWVVTDAGTRYWYGPTYYRDSSGDGTSSRPVEIDGKTYLFNRKGYMQTGIVHQYMGEYDGGIIYYNCGTDGVATLLTGPYKDYYYVAGLRQKAYQLFEHDGDYYYVSDGHKIAKNVKLYLNKALEGTGLSAGYYEFDAEGKMIIEKEEEPSTPDTESKNGVYDDYLYINGEKQLAYQLVEFEGNYYYVSDGHKIAKNEKLYLNKAVEGKTFDDGTPLQKGYYEFDANGKMILLNGPVNGFFYKNGVKQLAYQLVEYMGNYYYISDGHKLAMNTRLYLKKALEGTDLSAGYYEFDADGKMILRNGPYNGFFYKNGQKLLAYQLVEFEGNYYYISDGHKLAVNTRLYLNKALEGTGLAAGYYEFNAEGKMVLRNGPYNGFFYKNGEKLLAYQLVEFEGNYYYISDGHKLAVNTRLYLNKVLEGTGLPAGYYEFDADGKMIIK